MSRYILLLAILLSFQSLARAESAETVFAGGCFWCMESFFQELEGVTDVVSGFAGGDSPNPTYKGNHEGHYEVVYDCFTMYRVSCPWLSNLCHHN